MDDNGQVQYGILGTTQALRNDGTPVAVGGPRLRALLAALALRAGKPVPSWVLIEEVWGQDPPADPQDALQTLVARLRRALGPQELASVPDGYRLTSADTDLSRFEALAAEDSAESLRAALALWRGPALVDLPDRTDAAARCEAQREAARRRLLEAELALGRAEEVLRELAGMVERQPLDESLQLLRLRALSAAGRAPEALLGYEEFRLRLADALGTDPGPALRALHATLLTHPGPVDPVPVAPPEAIAVPVPVPVPASAAANFRPRLTSFVGRDADLVGLRSALAGRRLLTLTGPGGSGKTRLAQEAARSEPAEAFPDGVWLVELAPLDDPQSVPGAVLSALGLRATLLHVGSKTAEVLGTPAEPDSPMERLLDHCAGRRLLIVLDNCEHLVQAAAELAEQIVANCPGVTVLATSREPLGVPGEAVLPVEPLPDRAALRLLAERGAVDPERDPEACAEICRRLDGLPLAIELAAARLRALTPRQLADRLDRRFQLLTGGSRTHLPRQQTLRAVVDWSWDLLDKPERLLLARLSVFAGGWTLDAAEQVCVDEWLPSAEIAPLLASLVDKSLVQASLESSAPRYRMLETIHEYATERRQELPDSQQMTDRHICHYRELARVTDPLLRGRDQRAALDLLEVEHDNLRTALRRAVATGAEHDALSLALSLSWFWQLRNYESESHTWFAAATALHPGDPFAVPPVPLVQGPMDLPPPWSPEVLAEARRAVALCGFVSAQTVFSRNPDPELVLAGDRVRLAYPPELPQSATLPALFRVYALMFTGQFEYIVDTVEDIVRGCRAQGLEWELAFALQLRGKISNDQPDALPAARADAQESLDLFTRLGDSWGMAEALAGQAENASFTGDFELAVHASGRAIELARGIGAEPDLAMLEVRHGDALVCLGRLDEGERYLLAGIADARTHGPRGQGAGFFGSCMLALLRAHQGRLDEARTLVEALLRGPELSFGEQLAGLVEGMLGWLDARQGHPREGLLRLRAGVAQLERQEIPSPWSVGQLALVLAPSVASVLLENARHQPAPGAAPADYAWDAAALLGAYEALRIRPVNHYLEHLEVQATTEALRQLLGDQAFDRAHARGRQLDLVGAVALMRGDGPDQEQREPGRSD
ncbi:BTAD domain-containing putative transcriptional regulator [Streptacidiphilus sp. P02-A3a]|uniref:BTAD domain-containing putative transcriptional regulator n=1 Tax=Streptacidiphilus sp. P02-A3a TaxID=2704468 RepID=UPI0015FDAFB7|nr:BTAD domain-containing putative transcriptional regulator [Streptacidiphilus sp. P02-A3a]QMU68410.1 AAA family ATPase [Streptacidiphilus sp. P02-A3a]